MSSVSALNHFESLNFEGSDFIRILSERGQTLLFSYSPIYQSFLAWSPNVESVLGMADEDILIGPNAFLRHVHEQDRFHVLQTLENAIDKNLNYNVTYRWRRPDNDQIRWLNCRATLNKKAENTLLEGIVIDLSDQLELASKTNYDISSTSALIESLPEAIIICDEDLNIIIHNQQFFQLHNLIELNQQQYQQNFVGSQLNKLFSNLVNIDSLQHNLQAVLHDQISHHQELFKFSNSVIQLDASPLRTNQVIYGLIIKLCDITERHKLDQKVAELTKLENTHRATYAAINNFNNTLQSILGSILLIERNAKDSSFVKKTAATIREYAQSCAELFRKLEHLNHLDFFDGDSLDINTLLLSILNDIKIIEQHNDKILLQLGYCYRTKTPNFDIKSLLTSIIEGYLHILPVDNALLISSFTGQPHKQKFSKQKKSWWTAIRIHFANKFNNEQAMLELEVLFKNLKQFKIEYSIEKTTDNFISTLYFPAIVSKVNKALSNSKNNIAPKKSLKHVLVIDDDHMVLKTIEAMFMQCGYYCLKANNQIEALELYKKHHDKLSLVLVDAIMQDTEGDAVIRQLIQIDATVPLLGFTGADNLLSNKLKDAGAKSILQKPIGIKELETAIKKFSRIPAAIQTSRSKRKSKKPNI